MEPRAYASAPVGLHAFAAAYSYSSGSLLFDPTLPIKDVEAKISGVSTGYFQSLNLFGRYSSLTATLPYVWGPIQGLVEDEFTRIRRSGLGSPRFRLAVNLYGAPALKPRDFVKYQQKTNIGLSFTLTTPLGQYDPAKLLNLGSNRWAFKPEVGISHARGRWILEFAAGTWFFGRNDQFLSNQKREQDTVFSLQGHLIYSLPKRMWIGFDANFLEEVQPSWTTNTRLLRHFVIPGSVRHFLCLSTGVIQLRSYTAMESSPALEQIFPNWQSAISLSG